MPKTISQTKQPSIKTTIKEIKKYADCIQKVIDRFYKIEAQELKVSHRRKDIEEMRNIKTKIGAMHAS